MDFSDKEMKVLLQALYRFRGEVSGASQSEQNKYGVVSSVIDKIEAKVGPVRAERTRFDEEMEENLAVLATGRAGASRERARASAEPELDNGGASPKVKKASSRKATAAKKGAGKTPRASSKKAPGQKKAGPGKTRS